MKWILKLLRFWGLLILLISAQSVFTQPYSIRFQHLSIEQGLSHNEAFAFTQDKYGLIWIATPDGLNRFDGYEVEIYRHESDNENSLPDNMVRSIFTDSRGTIWIGTSNGLAYYDDHTNSFHSFFKDPDNENSLPSNWITVINEDAGGLLWIGTTSGLCSFNIKKNYFRRYLFDKNSNSISNNDIRDIEFTPDRKMWITTGNGLNCLNLSNMQFTPFFHDPADKTTLSGNDLAKMAIDTNGNIWTYLRNTLYLDCFDTKTNKCKRYLNFIEQQSNIPSNYIRSIFIDKRSKLWIGTNATGLHCFFPENNVFYEYKVEPYEPGSLQSNSVVDIFQDHSGLIWIATASSGVDRFNPDQTKFSHYKPQKASSATFVQDWVRAIAEDSSHHLWIGTVNGVSILDRNTGTYTTYQWNPNDPYSLSDNSVRSMCVDKRGNFWVGTAKGLNLFDPIHRRFHVFYSERNNHSIAGNFINDIICDKNGDMLIATSGGLTICDARTRRFSNFKNDTVDNLLNGEVRVIFEDNKGLIWLGTVRNGLIEYNRTTGELKHFTSAINDRFSLATNFVCSITEDHKGIIWVGTNSGLCCFNEARRTFTRFSEKEGLPNVHVGQLLVDDKDRIWMSTNKGLSVLNENRTAFTNYDPSDGLQGWEFNDQSAFKTHDGYFCYCGKNGFNIFHPDSIGKNKFIPPLLLKRITIFDQPLPMDSSYSNLKSLRLSYKKNFFSFEFAALNYDHPEKNQYACQLINFDEKIRQLGTNRVVSYTNVPPGDYKLKVMASNNDNVWNEYGYELALSIGPPFWKTWWFRSIMIIAFLGAVFLFFKIRENRIKKEEARQTEINKQIAEIRMVALRAQMNPHFIFNSLNSVQHFINIREKEEALNYLSKFSKLIRKILENSRENTVSLSNELQLLELYIQLEQLRFSNKFEYHIKVDERIDIENTEIPPLLIQPYVENAILHGLINKNGKGDLWFSLEKNDGLLICKIEDNGIGRAKAQEIEQTKDSKHRSLGIKVTNERISTLSALLKHKAEVLIEDLFESKLTLEVTPQPSGTRVTIIIPVEEEE
ncbi:MAG TPA: two-component regulator propeller domain-containing protein [Chitinophagaceae bacterium]|nr:two-component regulator propeller domain-containing protein [Chitinophagaceae bacterium]